MAGQLHPGDFPGQGDSGATMAARIFPETASVLSTSYQWISGFSLSKWYQRLPNDYRTKSWVGVAAKAAIAATTLSNQHFRIDVDQATGAVLSIVNPGSESQMSWIGSPKNAPWQPLGSHWGLGFVDVGVQSLRRSYWTNPQFSKSQNGDLIVNYTAGPLRVDVIRSLDSTFGTFSEEYTFTNNGVHLTPSADLTATAIFTPFNDHYTDTSDSLGRRAHTHIWANGGSSAWVKQVQMGGHGPHLGLVVTVGALLGYSIEARDTVANSNTRGVFLLHPKIPYLNPGDSSTIKWTMFWHDEWDDFFDKCAILSDQFINFNVSSYTAVAGEDVTIELSGKTVDNKTTVNGQSVQCEGNVCSAFVEVRDLGEHIVKIWAGTDSSIVLNAVPSYDDLIAARTAFITQNQQAGNDTSTDGAYVVYDNQMNAISTWENNVDRNSGRERVGMGVLIGRWLKDHPDAGLEKSFIKYYEWVCTQLQEPNGYVYNGPAPWEHWKRLYNWSWIMQLHLVAAALNLTLPNSISTTTPMQRFMITVDNFYSEGGSGLYAIGLPVLEGLRALNASGDIDTFQRALSLFIGHGEFIAGRGIDYPPFEVNFEQSIVAPAATILLELHRFTGNATWLDAAKIHFDLLLGFGGRQPDYHLHDVAIRHWDGYWFGKERMWGDTFPHYWSTLTALAMHHYSIATGDASYDKRADSVIRSNLALFTPDGRGSCAWLYPLSVNGRKAHHADPYANDQDWALAHLLQIRSDNQVG